MPGARDTDARALASPRQTRYASLMRTYLAFLMVCGALVLPVPPGCAAAASGKKVVILPVRDDIMPPLVYVIRRGVKEAMDQQADLLVLDMDTNGGRLDVTRDIIEIIEKFKGDTVTYVNKNAFSAGAFVSAATKHIYMAPGSVIGAAAPIMVSPMGDGVEKLSDTYEKKMVSAVRAMVRTSAQRNGYNTDVFEAMIDKTRGLKVDDKVIAKEGDILTLTDTEAEKEYGHPAKRLLSSGTVENLDALLKRLGYEGAQRIEVKPTGAERLGSWINAISPLLLIIGVIGIYIEFKSPGFGLPGIVAIVAFGLYFLGGYVAGFSGAEWMLAFLAGLVLVALEIFVFPGTVALGVTGAMIMLVAVVMALVDLYPAIPAVPAPGLPAVPSLPEFGRLNWQMFERPLYNLLVAVCGSAVCVWLANKWLPDTPIYRALVSQSASGVQSVLAQDQQRHALSGQIGVALSPLRPGGKAQFGDAILDVMTQGDLIPPGARVRIIGFSATEAVVEVA